jgi:hypothetical protein
VAKIHSVPQTSWLDKENCIVIPRMTILVPGLKGGGGGANEEGGSSSAEWVPWAPITETDLIAVL